ncbi:MAG: transporter substrate-binding domain-containing protein [Deferribacterales bacterium]
MRNNLDKIKIILVLLVFIISLTILIYFNTDRTSLNDQEKRFLHDKSEIVFVSQINYPPFEFLANNLQSSGMMIELIHWIASEYGFKAKFINSSFANAQKMVLEGEADVLTSLFYSRERDKKFDFTKPVFEISTSIFVKFNDDSIKELSDIKNKKVAIQKGDYAIDYLKSKKIDYTLVETDDFISAANLLIKSEVDAVVGDEPIIFYELQQLDLIGEVKNIGKSLYVGLDCMATKDGNKILISILNKGITRAKNRGVLDNIQRKWTGKTVKHHFYEHRYILITFSILLLIVIFVIVWNITLRQIVNKKTEELKKINTELILSINRFNAILKSSPDGIGMCDLDGKILFISDKLLEMYGYTLDEKDRYVGENIRDFIHEDYHEKLNLNFKKLLENEKELNISEYLAKKKNGEVFWIEVSSSVIKDNLDNPVAIVFTERDITDRKNKEELLLMIIKGIPHPAWLINKDRKIVAQNNAAEAFNTKIGDYCWYGIHKCKTIPYEQKSYYETHGIPLPGTMCTFCKGDECLNSKISVNKEVFLDGRYWDVWWIPVDDNRYLHYAVDITKFRQIEEELKIYNKKLEDIVIESNTLRELAEEANRAKSRFLAIISHELRTPLTAISGALELIKKDKSLIDSYIDILISSTEQLKILINDITDLNKIENNKLELVLKNFNLRKILVEVAYLINSIKSNKDIAFYVDIYDKINGEVVGDPIRLKQVLLNLLNNAIKFTSSGYIKLHVKIINETEKNITYYFEVEDTGIGIAKEDLDKLFKPFSQIDTTHSKKYYGSGIGLYLSQSIINAMGGKIEVESEVGKGSKFYFTITLEKAEKYDQDKIEATNGQFFDIKVLVVDDNKVNLLITEKLMKNIIKSIDLAENGYRALEMVRKNNYDAIFMDIQMPGMDGLEATMSIREFNKDVKIFAMSANVYKEDMENAIKSGMNDFCPKPISLNKLKELLNKYFSKN